MGLGQKFYLQRYPYDQARPMNFWYTAPPLRIAEAMFAFLKPLSFDTPSPPPRGGGGAGGPVWAAGGGGGVG